MCVADKYAYDGVFLAENARAAANCGVDALERSRSRAFMMEEICRWISQTAVSQTIQTVTWVIPAIQSLHILAVAIVMSSVLMFDLRVLGLAGRATSLADASRRFLPYLWIALLLLLATGLILIVGEPRRELLNMVFRAKLVMVAVVAALTLVLQRHAREERGGGPVPKIIAFLSLILWSAILTAGRWIAYTTDG